MAKANIKEQETQRQENVAQTVSKTEEFFNQNGKTLWGIVIAVVAVGLGILAYYKYVYQPKCAEAMEQAYQAELKFQAGEFELALKGDGNILGLEQIIQDYGSKAGKAVYLEAAVCALRLGEYEDALSYAGKYSGKDVILAARALSVKGDALVGLERYEEAVKCYNAAANTADNNFTAAYLVKAGSVYEKLGNKAEALKCYKTVKEFYPQSVEAYEIDKFIAGVEE